METRTVSHRHKCQLVEIPAGFFHAQIHPACAHGAGIYQERRSDKGGQYYFSSTKNDKKRTIALSPSLVRLFRYQKQQQLLRKAEAAEWVETNLVFTNAKGGFLSYRTVYDCFKRIVKKMGCPELRFHDLRHQYAVIAIKNGDDIKTIQGNLGHATATFTLDVYGHVTEEMKKNSADRMESYIASLMNS